MVDNHAFNPFENHCIARVYGIARQELGVDLHVEGVQVLWRLLSPPQHGVNTTEALEHFDENLSDLCCGLVQSTGLSASAGTTRHSLSRLSDKCLSFHGYLFWLSF